MSEELNEKSIAEAVMNGAIGGEYDDYEINGVGPIEQGDSGKWGFPIEGTDFTTGEDFYGYVEVRVES